MCAESRRRVERVLAADFVSDIGSIDVGELRRRRAEAKAEEDDLSYQRRLLHGQLDILKAELERRQAEDGTAARRELIGELSRILSQGASGGSRGVHTRVGGGPAAVPRRREDERAVFDAHLARLPDMTAEDIGAVVDKLVAEERRISDLRRRVQRVEDTLTEALTARYRVGDTSVADVLGKREGNEPDSD